MSLFNKKRVSDPVHGTIGLSDLELKIISASAFQRLRHVKQLGLAYYVFPGADYSRFSHCLGVCHITGRILASLQESGVIIEERDIQRYRLAALLHDVGHYPYSHAMEEAIENYYKSRLYTSGDETQTSAELSPSEELDPFYKHEALGKEILENDAEIKDILNRGGYKPKDIYSIFLREEPPKFANLVSSDLDADRIDYLLRTAHHTGLPYGSVDLDYLLSQITVDSNDRICLNEKALRTADHFLLGRYFDYQQVAFHKTVAALELILKDVLAGLLKYSLLDCSSSGIKKRLQNNTWNLIDDSYALERIREIQHRADMDPIILTKANSLLQRLPPKLVAEKETIQLRNPENKRGFLGQVHSVKREIPKWSSKFGIDKDLWYVWKNSVTLTKIGSHVPVSSFDEPEMENQADQGKLSGNRDKYEQEIRILGKSKQTSVPIFDLPYSLMSVLSGYELYSLRVYVLLPPDKESLRETITQTIKGDLPFIGWKD